MNCVLTLWMWWLWWATQPCRLRFCRAFSLLGVFRGGRLESCTALVCFVVSCDAYASSDAFAVYGFVCIVLLREWSDGMLRLTRSRRGL
jgi:hypothetical protein